MNWLRVFRAREVFPGISSILIAALDTGVFIAWPTLLLMLTGFINIFFSAFLINELVDSYDVDTFNPERNKAITKHDVSRKFTLIAFIVTSIAGVAILSSIGLFWAGFIGFLILFTYSAPPLRTKGWPFFELIAVTIGCALIGYISYYFLANQPFTWREIIILLFFATGFPAIQLVNEAADYEADKKAKIMTTAVFLGTKKTLILIEILSLLSAGLGLAAIFFTGHWWYLYIIAIIFFLFTAAQHGLSLLNEPERLHELLRTGEKFGVYISDLGTTIVIVIFLLFWWQRQLLF